MSTANHPGLRLDRKEISVLVIGTALALGSFRTEDPLIVVPMLGVSWIAFLYICATHEGRIYWRVGIAGAISLILAAIATRLFWAPIVNIFLNLQTWYLGPHGRWFDRLSGAVWAIAVVTASILTKKWVTTREARPKDQGQKGFLDYKLDAETAMTALSPILNKLTVIMSEVAPSINKHATELALAATTPRQLKVSRAASSTLDRSSAKVGREGMKYLNVGESLAGGLSGWAKWIEKSRPSKSSFADFPETMRVYNNAVNAQTNQMRTYTTTLERAKGSSRVLDAAIDRHVRSFEPIMNTNLRIYAASSEALKILDGLA